MSKDVLGRGERGVGGGGGWRRRGRNMESSSPILPFLLRCNLVHTYDTPFYPVVVINYTGPLWIPA